MRLLAHLPLVNQTLCVLGDSIFKHKAWNIEAEQQHILILLVDMWRSGSLMYFGYLPATCVISVLLSITMSEFKLYPHRVIADQNIFKYSHIFSWKVLKWSPLSKQPSDVMGALSFYHLRPLVCVAVFFFFYCCLFVLFCFCLWVLLQTVLNKSLMLAIRQ